MTSLRMSKIYCITVHCGCDADQSRNLAKSTAVESSFVDDLAETKSPCLFRHGLLLINAGDHLISHTVARAVPSAQRGLTSVFGMGTGDPSQYGHRQA